MVGVLGRRVRARDRLVFVAVLVGVLLMVDVLVGVLADGRRVRSACWCCWGHVGYLLAECRSDRRCRGDRRGFVTVGVSVGTVAVWWAFWCVSYGGVTLGVRVGVIVGVR